jgi:hypothetical protein
MLYSIPDRGEDLEGAESDVERTDCEAIAERRDW